jgi:hypothetical protein
MTTKEKTEGHPADHAEGCRIDIRIDGRGDVNIYNCTAPCPPSPAPQTEPCVCPPTATGACVPLALGAKPKQSRKRKLEKLLANNRVPSALAASFFHNARRFVQGRPAANPLEAQVFNVLRSLPPELKGVLSCALGSFDSLSSAERERLFGSALTSDPDVAIDPDTLAEAVGAEIVQRASIGVFGDPNAAEQERPGLIRVFDPTGSELPPNQVRICRINNLRTVHFAPPLSIGEYTPQELEQNCTLSIVDGQIQQNCTVETFPCTGNFFDSDTCMRVVDVETGQSVLLEGVNFFSIDAKVRLVARDQPGIVREVEAHVFGDIDTPREEVVGGALISDCRVHDRITFKVPDDLAPGLVYELRVLVPNITGIAALGDHLESDSEFIRAVVPATARFQIASETLFAREETSPESFGSDEVGIKMLAVPLLADGNTGAVQENKVRFGDVDTGDRRNMNRVLFAHTENIAGVALSIVGFEIDGEDAFEKQIDSFTDAYIDIVKREWDAVKELVAAAGGVSALKGLGLKGAIVLAIAAVLTLAVDVFIALWAPADLLIEDALGFTTVDLAELTNADLPAPSVTEYSTAGGIDVKVSPVEKRAQEYSELRHYASDDEDSQYEITLRYNRLA